MKFHGSFGTWLRQRRKALDLTQLELADQVGCSAAAIRKFESNERRPSKQICEVLSDVLAIMPEERDAFITFAREPVSNPGTPSLPVANATVHNLPFQTPPFVGRSEELGQLAQQLDDPACRLLTLVGSGGIGKTRLAIEAAKRRAASFADGVFFVSLVALSNPEAIAATIADLIGLACYPGSALKQQLLDYLRTRTMLLVLDNLEHLLAGAGIIVELLVAAPQLKILATSRERLNLQDEWIRQVEGMALPGVNAVQAVETYSAIQLFVQRARQVRGHFDLQAEQIHVIQICQMLDGVPLSILLAASWAALLSPAEIQREIAQGFDFLETTMHDVPERQRTLRAVFDQSWRTLSEREQACLMKLSVFRGGFTRVAAQAVAGATLRVLAALVNKSLLRRDGDGRYDIHELLRQYAAEQLNRLPQERKTTQDLHADYYAEFMDVQLGRLKSDQQRSALTEIDAERANVRVAWDDMIVQRKLAELHRSAAGLFHFLDLRGHYQEAADLARLTAEALGSAGADPETQIVVGQLLAHQAWFAVSLGFPEQGYRLAEQSRAMVHDERVSHDVLLAFTSLLRAGSYLVQSRDHYLELQRVAHTGLKIARGSDDQWHVALFLYWAGQYARLQKHYREAAQMGEEGLEIAEQLGDPWLIASLSGLLLGTVAYECGRYLEAKRRFEQGLRSFKESGQRWTIAVSYGHLGDVAAALSEFPEAEHWYRKRLELFGENGGQPWETLRTLFGIITVVEAQDRKERAVELLALYFRQHGGIKMHDDEAERLRTRLQSELPAHVFEAAFERGKVLEFQHVLAELLTESQHAGAQ